MEYRVENKYLVTDCDLKIIENRIAYLMKKDAHLIEDSYEIRSIYFDDINDSCMDENESGIDKRNKYRIRIYNAQKDNIKLEIKEKFRGYTKKQSCILSYDEYDSIMSGKNCLSFDDRKPLNQFILKMRIEKFTPKVLVTYERTAYVNKAGNVRVTFDKNISGCRDFKSFFNPTLKNSIPILPASVHILEVKYDEFLPDAIKQQLQLDHLQKTAFSKYYLCRKALDFNFPYI